MKKMMNWVLAATLVCGASMFTSCSDDKGDNPSNEQAKKYRQEFIQHTRKNLKDLAENTDFYSWELANSINNHFNQYVLNNPEFDRAIALAFMQQAAQTIQPVEEGSELAKMGYTTYGVVDFTDFNYRFTMKEDASGFDVEPADDFEMIIFSYDPGDKKLVPNSLKLTLKAGGSSFLVNMKAFGTDEIALVGKMPTEFAFTISNNLSGKWHDSFTGTFKNDVRLDGSSQFMDFMDAFNISGVISSNLRDLGDGLKADHTTVNFAIGQDPETHEAGLQLGLTHNGLGLFQFRAVVENLNGPTDLSKFNNRISISDAFLGIMAGNDLKEATITLLDDLTTTLKVTNCGEVYNLQRAMASARRNYADQKTIDQYVLQLNNLVEGSMTCKGLKQNIPMKLQTTKIGVDYWAVPALNFADEKGYVAITDMLDKESIEYMINIADHAVVPMKESIVVVRQLRQFMRMISGSYQSEQ